jgi:hypothetical protein
MTSLEPSSTTIQHNLFPINHIYQSDGDKNVSHEVVKLFHKKIPNYKHLPEIKLHSNECIDQGYIHLIPYDLRGKSAVKGTDGYGRPFVAYATFSRTIKVTCVNVIFQRDPNSTDLVSSCFTRGHALGHNQLFQSTPKIDDAVQAILSIYRGEHPNWKLQNS